MERHAARRRTTRETDVSVELCLDGRGSASVGTGVPFLDHMLDALARHGLFDLEVRASGDTAVDDHHTVEDVGIVLGGVVRDGARAVRDRRLGPRSGPR